ncbi:MAG: 16S rRNA (cytosine(1402)-N(4))-methyltransferase RsmH [Verrucomicrobiota bacterium]
MNPTPRPEPGPPRATPSAPSPAPASPAAPKAPDAPDAPAPSPGPAVHRRRPRYPGRHPRRFEEKYKEHAPQLYPGEVAKVMAGGKTPAGMHRSVMVGEVLAALRPVPGETAVDCTLGYGGHARELLARLQPAGRLLGLDVDPHELPRTESRLRAGGWGPDQLVVRASNFAGLARVLGELGWDGADVLLADLGVSSMQMDNPERGFTFKAEGPLDLRLNPNRGLPASEWLRRADATRLAAALRDHADEPHADLLAAGLAQRRPAGRPTTTLELAQAVREILAAHGRGRDREAANDSVRRVFQALRIEVNDEFGALEAWLRQLPDCLRPGGRVAVLSFHSGEDRRVKHAFREGHRRGLYSAVSDLPGRPGPAEIRANPRSAPARLRWALRSGAGC